MIFIVGLNQAHKNFARSLKKLYPLFYIDGGALNCSAGIAMPAKAKLYGKKLHQKSWILSLITLKKKELLKPIHHQFLHN